LIDKTLCDKIYQRRVVRAFPCELRFTNHQYINFNIIESGVHNPNKTYHHGNIVKNP
jgi:hypothetical protein